MKPIFISIVCLLLAACASTQPDPDVFDAAVQAISTGDAEAASLAHQFADAVDPWSVGPYLQGLAAMAGKNVETAHEYFSTAKDAQSNWVSPWLGWAWSARWGGAGHCTRWCRAR